MSYTEFCTWRTMLTVFSASSSTTIRQLYSITKMPTYGSYEYEKERSDTGLNRKQGLVETDSSVIINFDMF